MRHEEYRINSIKQAPPLSRLRIVSKNKTAPEEILPVPHFAPGQTTYGR